MTPEASRVAPPAPHPQLLLQPRPAWEAADLGLRLAQRHAGLLMASWALLTLPVLALLSALFPEAPGLVLLLFWWLKPAFERLPLHILGRALFGTAPTLGQALRAWPGLLRSELLASLTWRRFGLLRSFSLPVGQLERLHGAARRQRLDVLTRRGASARWLTVLGLHIELLLWLALVLLLWLLLPLEIAGPADWRSLLVAPEAHWLWLEHLGNLLYALVLVLWAPCYVACGFSLYLNRRCELEAWDLELAFRRLLDRLGHAALAVLLGCVLLLPTPPALAADVRLAAHDPGPAAARLQGQALDSAQARRDIAAILAAPPFRRSEERLAWRWAAADEAALPSDAPPPAWTHSLAGALEVLLWSLLAAALGVLAWRWRRWRRLFVAAPEALADAQAPIAPPPPATSRAAPADLAARAERLWPEQPRAALALLYAGLLDHLAGRHRLALSAAHTEDEVRAQLAQLDNPALLAFATTLLDAWQALAWGAAPVAPDTGQALCRQARRLFGAPP